MIGVYDFCGHYEWTFSWLADRGGEALVKDYWDKSIHQDSQQHAAELIQTLGIEGMKRYWGHTLAEEEAGYTSSSTESSFRIDMHRCPSKGFLITNGLQQYSDYCNHCIGWIGPMMQKAGFQTIHEHNHCGQCWWEFRRQIESDEQQTVDPEEHVGTVADEHLNDDIRLSANWKKSGHRIDSFGIKPKS